MISAVVHTYNEEKNIQRCLSSLSWTDEIVLIDMGSLDRTVEIAKQHKASIYHHPFTHFVEPARNFGISKAKSEWVLIVDADEEVPTTLSQFLQKAVTDDYDYYRIPRKNIIFGKWVKHAGWWPDHQVRFFTKGSVKWANNIHGVPVTKGNGTDIEAFEQLSLIHHNYQTIDQYIARLNRYTTIAAKEYFLANKKFQVSLLFDAPIKEFVSRFFVREGYKDGLHGLGLALLQSFSEIVLYLKVWELEGFVQEKVKLIQIEKEFENEFNQKQYWITHSLLTQDYSILQKFLWKLKRKFHYYG